jgi:uncharacterized protein YbbC (DUF1343 family)
MSVGLDELLARVPERLRGARVGLLAHAASVDAQGVHAADRLASHPDLRLVRLFGPEHGFFGAGAAGEKMGEQVHPRLGLPIHSLYGATRTPPPEWLSGMDALLIDFQDIGVRCYTYASTLENVLGACHGVGLPVCVLDRPIPLHGVSDGPMLDPAQRSFVGQVDTRFIYGMTPGELAVWLRRRHAWEGLELTVLRGDGAEGAWTKPSPGIVSRDAARLYPLTVWCEAIPGVSVDRGGERSFQVWGMEGLPAADLAGKLRIPGLRLRESRVDVGEKAVPAVDFDITGPFRPAAAAVSWLAALRDRLGAERLFAAEGARAWFFDRLWGSARVGDLLRRGATAAEIVGEWAEPDGEASA